MDLELSGRGQQQQGPSSNSSSTSSASQAQPRQPPRPSPPAFYAAAPPPPLPQNHLPLTFVPPPLSGQASSGLLPPPPTYTSSLPLPSQPASLDDLADAFLSASQGDPPQPALSGGDADGAAPSVRLRPEPLDASLPGGNGGDDGVVDRLSAVAARRAWADVVAMAQQLIKPGGTSLYATLYGDLLRHHSAPNLSSVPTSASSTTPPPSAVLALESQQDELGDILVLLVKGLLHLRRYLELKQLLDQWGFLFHHSVRSRGSGSTRITQPTPTWIPWRLHILAATALLDLPPTTPPASSSSAPSSSSSAATGSPTDALDVLWMIRDALPSTDLPSTILAEQALSNALVRTKRWRMAIGCLQRIMDLLPAAVQENQSNPQTRYASSPLASTPDELQVLEASYRVELLSCQGRILLQLGALPEADQVFQEARAAWDESSTLNSHDTASAVLEVVRRAPIQLAANNALLCFASNRVEQALELFRHVATLIRQDAAKLQPTHDKSTAARNASIASGSDGAIIGVPPLSSLYSETCNNMALCAIYTCRLHEAIHLMESLVRNDPTRYLTDRVALNLCTLYELSSDTAVASRKKRVLQVIAKRFFLHDIGSECFRLG